MTCKCSSCITDSALWRSIETAPRDGTPVLAYTKYAYYYVAEFRFPRPTEPQYNYSHSEKEWRDHNGRWASPTHWLPLPAPPYKRKL